MPNPDTICRNKSFECGHKYSSHECDADWVQHDIDGHFVGLTACLVEDCECHGFTEDSSNDRS